ncbi:DUF4235 domain-containing protein, partial [Brooklawnia sp.]|uniref:DUF4235 domain-containing protein n=1 Tax=Brooklawnia sp. TaxID=2699740 RepID=UPI00311DAF75
MGTTSSDLLTRARVVHCAEARRWPRIAGVSDAANQSSPISGVEFKIVAGALGAVATFAVQKLIQKGWKQITGQEPPDPND